MNDGSERQNDDALNNLLPWAQCELFCIADYAGTGHSPCGWRGRIGDAQRDRESRFLCPRCRRVTLLRIPSDHSNEPLA